MKFLLSFVLMVVVKGSEEGEGEGASFTTGLTAQATAGQTQLAVQDVSQFNIGDTITLSDGTNTETNTIIGISVGRRMEGTRRLATAGTLTLATPLVNTYAVGATTITQSVIYVGSDPITFYNGEKTKFWFPNGQLLPVVETKDVTVWAETFGCEPQDQAPPTASGLVPKSEDLQWFGKIAVTLPNGKPVVTVSIKKKEANRTAGNQRPFEQIDVVLGDPSSSPLRTLNKRLVFHTEGTNVNIAISREQNSKAWADQLFREQVYVEAGDIAFGILPVPAYVEFPNSIRLSRKYKHLDFVITDMKYQNTYTGIFPELWGTQPTSAAVEAMKTPPSERLTSATCAASAACATSAMA